MVSIENTDDKSASLPVFNLRQMQICLRCLGLGIV